MDGTLQATRKLRCAIYTRKSTEDGLEQEFNTLDAQREACEAYITSQRSEGWVAVREHYDDGGFSGGTLERPALRQMLADIEDGLVDVIVVYKIDRLSRSLMDFARLVEIFDRNQVTFVSVTQSFNTTTSMGRLTLNILLSFAQFEREVTGERIRDKIAASRRKGMWMGGSVPFGYVLQDRKLVPHDTEAPIVKAAFERYVDLGSSTLLARELQAKGVTTKAGNPPNSQFVIRMLQNPVYAGMARHKDKSFPGEHEAIVDQAAWDRVQERLKANGRKHRRGRRPKNPAYLRGLIFHENGAAMTPHHTGKKNKEYCYYVSTDYLKVRHTEPSAAPQRLAAGMVEGAVVRELRRVLRSPEIAARTAAELGSNAETSEVAAALQDFDNLWAQLFHNERARIVQLLVHRVTVTGEGLAIDLRADGLKGLASELMAPQEASA